MHELGVVIEVVKTVEKVALENNLTKVDSVVLQIGELSSMIPKYIESCFPVAVDNTSLQDTKLKIEIIPANCICKNCNKVFNVKKNKGQCIYCSSKNWDLLSGKEFVIKEIIAY
ncbi:MAG: hydrogenase maturation nickel metallochaperone HypA [Terrisporobacter sp.]